MSQVGAGQAGASQAVRVRGLLATSIAAVAVPVAAIVAVLSLSRESSPPPPPPPPPAVAVAATPAASPAPSITPAPATPAPATSAPVAHQAAPASSGPRGGNPAPPPTYPLVAHFDAPSVGVHINVVSVGLDRHGAMEAPEGRLGSSFWREGFWYRGGAVPGNPGTATIAGHLDDTAGRPAAFWTIRNLRAGDEVTVTRVADGAVLKYKIVETDVWTVAQATQHDNLQRIYGGGGADGVARLSLITCTGRWVHGGYDHRFVAFAVLET